MDEVQFGMMMKSVDEVKSDVKDVRVEQRIQGKQLERVCTRVKAHGWIHRTIGLGVMGLLLAWVKIKLG